MAQATWGEDACRKQLSTTGGNVSSGTNHLDLEHPKSWNKKAKASRSRSCSSVGSSHVGRGAAPMLYSESMKGRKVTFFRNGDPFYKGLQFAIRPIMRKMEPYQAFELLLAEINNSGLCDTNLLKQGVRYIFDMDGSVVTNVHQMADGARFVCSSTPTFKSLDYGGSSSVDWVVTTKKVNSPTSALSMDIVAHHHHGVVDEPVPSKAFTPPKSKMVVVIRAGPRPRNIARKVLNKRTASSFGDVIVCLSRAINMESGLITRLCTLYGRPVTELQDFFLEDQVFIAFGNEKPVPDDFKISDSESKFIESACGSLSPVASAKNDGEINVSRSSHSDQPVMSPSITSSLPTTSVQPASSNLQNHFSKCKMVTKVNRGYSGKAYGIPIQLLTRYKVGRILLEADIVLIKRCYEKAKDGRKCALKIVRRELLNPDEQTIIMSELTMLRRLKHPNLLTLVDELSTPNEWYFVMELFPGGDLFDAVVLADKFRYTESTASWILHELLVALDYMHSLSIVHRNIRLENILVTSLAENVKSFKLGDFGLATEVNGFLHDIVGSEFYHAPEMFTTKGYGLKADVWAVGVVAYILLCGFPPFGSSFSVRDVLSSKTGCRQVTFPSPYWDRISDAAKDLILFMLESDQFERGSASDMLEHPWLANPVSIANDIDIHESVANLMKDLIPTSTRFSPTNVGLIAVTALDQGLGFQLDRNITDLPTQFENTNESGSSSFTKLSAPFDGLYS